MSTQLDTTVDVLGAVRCDSELMQVNYQEFCDKALSTLDGKTTLTEERALEEIFDLKLSSFTSLKEYHGRFVEIKAKLAKGEDKVSEKFLSQAFRKGLPKDLRMHLKKENLR